MPVGAVQESSMSPPFFVAVSPLGAATSTKSYARGKLACCSVPRDRVGVGIAQREHPNVLDAALVMVAGDDVTHRHHHVHLVSPVDGVRRLGEVGARARRDRGAHGRVVAHLAVEPVEVVARHVDAVEPEGDRPLAIRRQEGLLVQSGEIAQAHIAAAAEIDDADVDGSARRRLRARGAARGQEEPTDRPSDSIHGRPGEQVAYLPRSCGIRAGEERRASSWQGRRIATVQSLTAHQADGRRPSSSTRAGTGSRFHTRPSFSRTRRMA